MEADEEEDMDQEVMEMHDEKNIFVEETGRMIGGEEDEGKIDAEAIDDDEITIDH